MFVRTVYDAELHETVFVLRNEDKYSSATRITTESSLEGTVGDTTTVTITVEDLIGTGTVEYYINGVFIESKTTTGSISFDYTILEGINDLTFKFTGNEQCLKSQLTVGFIGNAHIVEPASISLSVDNSTIMTGETATVSALVLDANGNPCPNVAVSFTSDIPNSTEYNTITNHDGIANYTFNSQGYGSTVISASTGELEDTTTIEDYIGYYLDEQSRISDQNSDVNYFTTLNPVFDNPNVPFELSFDMKFSKAGNFSGTFGMDAGLIVTQKAENNNNCAYRCCLGYNNWRVKVYSNGGSKEVYNSPNYDNWWNNIRIIVNGTSTSIYNGNTLLLTVTMDWSNYPEMAMGITEWQRGGMITVRNVRVKKLSS